MNVTPYEPPDQRRNRILLTAFSVLVLAFLSFPIVITVPLSFSAGDYIRYPVESLSLRWYRRLFSDPQWSRAILNTLFVGAVSAALSVGLGTAAAYGVHRMQSRLRGAVIAIAMMPMVVPPIIIALSSYLFFLRTGISDGYLRVIIGHTVLGIPFVVLVVYSALQSLDPSQHRAALSLGARPWLAFRVAVLPRISRAMAGGGLLAFATSADELIISMFVTTARERTLPVQMFTGLREQLSPVITAAATLLLTIATLLLVLNSRRQTEKPD